MPPLAIYAERALTPLKEIRDAVIVVDGARIAAVGHRGEIEVPRGAAEYSAGAGTVVPGFVDVHIHGAGGHDVMEGTEEAFDAVTETVARFGTTSFVATTVTASPEETCRSVAAIARAATRVASETGSGRARAEILGAHFEGPFISAARRGVHPAVWIAAPSIELLDRFVEAAHDTARMLTLAPELPGALKLVSEARRRGLIVAMGHTDASYAEAEAAIAAGVRHAAHVFNAMRPFSHRETGVLGAVLTSHKVTAELIADGVHVDDAAIRVLLAAKGVERTVLVSDGTAATGMPDGKYRLGTFEVTVTGGVCRNAEGKLAGSTLTLDRAVRHMVSLGVGLSDAVRMATFNPARVLGMETRKGILAAGADADLVLLDEKMQVAGVMARGLGWPVTSSRD
ncbi:MAG: N-acetylglucosamine-6-phosphate deacetylase [Candidatus Acidiferrales bacterium]